MDRCDVLSVCGQRNRYAIFDGVSKLKSGIRGGGLSVYAPLTGGFAAF